MCVCVTGSVFNITLDHVKHTNYANFLQTTITNFGCWSLLVGGLGECVSAAVVLSFWRSFADIL